MADRAPDAPGPVVPWLISLGVHGGLAALLLIVPAMTIDASVLPPIELTERKIEPPKPPEPEPPKPEPKKVEPDQPKPEPKIEPRRIRKPKPQPTETPPEPPSGQPESKTPPAEDTGPKAFGIEMEGTTAPTGTGVAVPTGKGKTLRANPKSKRVGKGVKKTGFKEVYEKGEYAPTAVITVMPKIAQRVVPTYPERLRDLGIEGRVRLELTVDETGRVVKARVLQSLHPLADAAAIAAAKKTRFAPARVGGNAVKTKIPFSFVFTLD